MRIRVERLAFSSEHCALTRAEILAVLLRAIET